MRRTSLNKISAELVEHLIKHHGLTVTRIAEITHVDKSFASRVKNAHREFSMEHLALLADHLGVDVGVMLVDMDRRRDRPVKPELQAFHDKCEQVILMAGELAGRLRKKRLAESRPAASAG